MKPDILTIAITGMNARPDNPGPGLAVAKCLKESESINCKIVGLSYDSLDPGLYLSKYCNTGYLLPYPSAGEDALIERIKQIHKIEKIDLLIPCLDSELPSFIRLEYLIHELGIKTYLPTAEQLRYRNKDQLQETADHAGMECPDIKPITSAGFFYDCQEKGWQYPLVIKGIFYEAIIVSNEEEASKAFRNIASKWGLPVLVQKFIKGEEYNLTAVGDGNGSLLNPVMMKKLALTDKGKAWAGVSIFDQTLLDAAESLCKALNWRGPLEVEVMKTEKGQYQLIEINPRFPAWIYLSTGVGKNLPEIMVNLIFSGQSTIHTSAQSGKIFIRYAEEFVIDMKDFEAIVMHGDTSIDQP